MKKTFLLLTFLLSLVAESMAQAVHTPVLDIIGDSYVANHRRPKEETWHYLLAKELGMEYNNYGRNGSCVAFDRTNDKPYNFGPAMWQRYKAMKPNADYVLIIAGHNDASKVKDNKDSLAMFRDSLVTLIEGIRKDYPTARIGYVTPWDVDRPGFKQVCKIIKSVCKKYKIPVLDNNSGKCIITTRNADFRREYFQGPDDTAHLNAKGHLLFLPVARAWFMKYVWKG